MQRNSGTKYLIFIITFLIHFDPYFFCPVQPDSPQIVKCEEVEQGLNVTIDPPSSWSTPHSFFKLEHEIEYVLKDNGEVHTNLHWNKVWWSLHCCHSLNFILLLCDLSDFRLDVLHLLSYRRGSAKWGLAPETRWCSQAGASGLPGKM